MTIQKILLVDDSKTELHHLSDLLGKRGYSVRTAENGEEAMKRLGEATHRLFAIFGRAHGVAPLAEQIGEVVQFGLRIVDNQNLADSHRGVLEQFGRQPAGGLGMRQPATRQNDSTARSNCSFVNGLVR